MSDEPRIYITDVYELFCARGAKQWFKKYNIDFRNFLKHGCPASELAATGDPLAEAVIAYAKTKVEINGRG